MAARQPFSILGYLGRVVRTGSADRSPDGELLERFVTGKEEAAFQALLDRYGVLVLSVCRRQLQEPHDVEDAFQATFLVLARRAHAIAKRESVASWLYGVAQRTARRTRSIGQRRQAREQALADLAAPEAADPSEWQELRGILDEEVNRLPEKYRTPLVLCYLMGQSNEEAARQLGWPIGTVWGRLARGRDLLRDRLVRRGVATATVVAALETSPALAAMPPTVLQATLKLVSASVGKTVAALAGGRAAIVAKGVLFDMWLTQIKYWAVALLAGGLLLGGVGVMVTTWAAESGPPARFGPAGIPGTETKQVSLLETKLNQLVNIPNGIEGNTPLKDALEFLADRHGLKVTVDAEAFAAEGIQKIEEQPAWLPVIRKVSLRTVLELLADNVYGEMKVENDQVVFVPLKEGKPARRVAVPASKQFQDKLDKAIDLPQGLAANTPLADALKSLEKQHDLTILIDKRAFAEKDLAWQEAAEQPVSLPVTKNVPLSKVLDQLAKQAKCAVLVHRDHVRLVPAGQ